MKRRTLLKALLGIPFIGFPSLGKSQTIPRIGDAWVNYPELKLKMVRVNDRWYEVSQ
jgi:hypothetical protein